MPEFFIHLKLCAVQQVEHSNLYQKNTKVADISRDEGSPQGESAVMPDKFELA